MKIKTDIKKNIKKSFVMLLSAIAIVCSTACFVGCDYGQQNECGDSKYELVEIYNAYLNVDESYSVVYSRKTKVMYYIYNGKLQEMRDADGKLMVYKGD